VKNSRVPIGVDQKVYKDFYNRCTEKRRKPIPTFANFNKQKLYLSEMRIQNSQAEDLKEFLIEAADIPDYQI